MTVASAVLVPVAIAWACNPQASLRLNQPTFSPGGPIQVSGAFFKGNVSLTLTIEPGGAPVTVTTAGNGFFATGVTAPSAPGSYTLSAIGFEGDGSVTPGLPARVSFQVSPAGKPSAPGSPARPAPQSGATPPAATQPGGGGFAEPKVPKATPFGAPGSGKRGAKAPTNRGGAADRTAAVNTGAGVINSSGGGVFAGSIARADRRAAVASGEKSGAARQARKQGRGGTPSERSAAGDVWSGIGSGKAPSLMPRASDAAPAPGGTGLQFAWGLGLIAFGLLALTSGLAAAEMRRRRAHVR